MRQHDHPGAMFADQPHGQQRRKHRGDLRHDNRGRDKGRRIALLGVDDVERVERQHGAVAEVEHCE